MRLTCWQAFAAWLLGAPTGKAVLKVFEWLALTAGVLLSASITYMTEHQFLPVITEWRVEYINRVGNNWVVGGVLNKKRPCELVSVSVMAVPKAPLLPRQLVYQLKPSEVVGGNVPVGRSTWGPWMVTIPAVLEQHRDKISSLDIVAAHRCHAFWLQETYYGSVRIEDLP